MTRSGPQILAAVVSRMLREAPVSVPEKFFTIKSAASTQVAQVTDRITWFPVTGSTNYVSQDGRFIAVFKHAFGDHANYHVFPIGLRKSERTIANALSAGGLPITLRV